MKLLLLLLLVGTSLPSPVSDSAEVQAKTEPEQGAEPVPSEPHSEPLLDHKPHHSNNNGDDRNNRWRRSPIKPRPPRRPLNGTRRPNKILKNSKNNINITGGDVANNNNNNNSGGGFNFANNNNNNNNIGGGLANNNNKNNNNGVGFNFANNNNNIGGDLANNNNNNNNNTGGGAANNNNNNNNIGVGVAHNTNNNINAGNDDYIVNVFYLTSLSDIHSTLPLLNGGKPYLG